MTYRQKSHGFQFQSEYPSAWQKGNILTPVRTPDSWHIVLCSSVSRLLRNNRIILSDFTYFLSSCKIHGILLEIRIFGSSTYIHCANKQITELNLQLNLTNDNKNDDWCSNQSGKARHVMRKRVLLRPIVFFRVRCSILILLIKALRCSIRSL